MKQTLVLFVLVVIAFGVYTIMENDPKKTNDTTSPAVSVGDENDGDQTTSAPLITPIAHATMALTWGEVVLFTDPVGGSEAFDGLPSPDLILITDIHGDHLSVETLEAVVPEDGMLIAPQAVFDELTKELQTKTTVLANEEAIELFGIRIEAIPMYNLPDQGVEIRHEKGRGNGYVLERDGMRVYIAGDTADIPEMRALSNIDIAFLPMNMPYTMDVDRAADAVLAFKPLRVIPYHYRTPDGFADVERFRELVESADSNIQVDLLEWYPQ